MFGLCWSNWWQFIVGRAKNARHFPKQCGALFWPEITEYVKKNHRNNEISIKPFDKCFIDVYSSYCVLFGMVSAHSNQHFEAQKIMTIQFSQNFQTKILRYTDYFD